MVVRHADAGAKFGWDGPDVLRPLSPAGWRQADGLVVRLEDYPVERILCSPTTRCLQTVEPLARNRRLRIEPVARLGLEATTTELLAMVRDPGLLDAVLCTHGETISRLLERLVTTGGLVLSQPLHWPKGSTWLLQRGDRRQVRARYLPPLALDLPDREGREHRART
jgi:broad specificity phosphatase PhoE